jgi:hypothetical protein
LVLGKKKLGFAKYYWLKAVVINMEEARSLLDGVKNVFETEVIRRLFSSIVWWM